MSQLSVPIQKMTKVSVEMQDQSLDALLKKDLATASTIIDRMVHVRKLYDVASPLVGKNPERTALALSLIIRDIRAFAGYAVALADDAVLGVYEA